MTTQNIARQEQIPVVDPETLQFRRSVKDMDQAYSICKRLNDDNRERNKKNAAITKKLNDELPYSAKELAAAGQSWRNNRPTGFMSSLIRRVIPPYIQALDSARTLTSSSLRATGPEAEQKNEDFRVACTTTIRRWKGWGDFKYQMTFEDVVFGYVNCCWLDEYGWTPRYCRGDEAFFPNGSPQNAKDIPVWCLYQQFLICELASKLYDPVASEDAGWNIDNLVEAINNAQPKRDGMSVTPGQERKYEDTVREASLGRSYSEGVNVIETYTLFAQEYTGKVSQYMMTSKDGKPLFQAQDRFDSMEQCLRTLTVEFGNGKLHGSKGAGRVLYNTHVAADQARNLVADNLYLSGLVLLKGSTTGMKGAVITVVHPVAIIHEKFEVVNVKFDVNVEAFFQLDEHLTRIAELQIGAFMPTTAPSAEGEKTASEVNYIASIEMQIREGVLARFFSQFLGVIHEMQKRIYSKDNIAEALDLFKEQRAGIIQRVSSKMLEFIKKINIVRRASSKEFVAEKNYENPEAVQSCLDLLNKGLTGEEIFELGQCPPNEVTDEMTAQRAQAIDAVVLRYKGDPGVRQNPLTKYDISSKLGNTIAEELIIPEEDNTLQAEATRLQLIELNSLSQGEDIPVSPRDVDPIHMQVIMEKAGELLGNLSPQSVTPETLKIADAILTHFEGHIQGALQKGMKPDQLKPQIEMDKKVRGLITQLGSVMSSLPQNALQIPNGAAPATVMAPKLPPAPPTTTDVPTLPAVPVPPNQAMPLSTGPKSLQPKIGPQ